MIELKEYQDFINIANDPEFKVVFLVDKETNLLYLSRYNEFGEREGNLCSVLDKAVHTLKPLSCFEKHLGNRIKWPDLDEFFEVIYFEKMEYRHESGDEYLGYYDRETDLVYTLIDDKIIVHE